ncbi:hypothetical protein JYT87_00215 [Nitrospira defluvii]|nr:hypothetical protein [Nitrospira defluvii]
MKHTVVIALLAATILTFLPNQVKSQENDIIEVLESSFYGGLTGTLIGAAFLAFRDKPSDHLKDLRVGAGMGVILGTIYGITKTTSRALAEVDNGKLTFHVPTLQLSIDPNNHALRASANLLRLPF